MEDCFSNVIRAFEVSIKNVWVLLGCIDNIPHCSVRCVFLHQHHRLLLWILLPRDHTTMTMPPLYREIIKYVTLGCVRHIAK